MQPRSKPTFVLSMIGATAHGKSTLADKLLRAFNGQSSVRFREGRECRFETTQRCYQLVDGSRHNGVLQSLLFGPTNPEGAIVVVTAMREIEGELIAQLQLLKRLSISSLVVVLTHVDLLNDDEAIDLVEVRVRELLLQEGFSGDETPFVRLRQNLNEVIEAIERFQPIPKPQIDDFLLLIDERFGSTNQELIAAGHIQRGFVQVGEPISFYSIDGQRPAQILGLDVVTRSQNHTSILDIGVIREKRSKASRGQWVACRFQKNHHRALYDSYAIAKPNSLKQYSKAKALLWLESTSVQASSLLFRVRNEKGAIRRLFEGNNPPTLEAKRIIDVDVSPLGLGHVEAPAYFDVVAPRIPGVLGFGVFISLR